MSKLSLPLKLPHADNAILWKAIGISDYSFIIDDFDNILYKVVDGVFLELEAAYNMWCHDFSGNTFEAGLIVLI